MGSAVVSGFTASCTSAKKVIRNVYECEGDATGTDPAL